MKYAMYGDATPWPSPVLQMLQLLRLLRCLPPIFPGHGLARSHGCTLIVGARNGYVMYESMR